LLLSPHASLFLVARGFRASFCDQFIDHVDPDPLVFLGKRLGFADRDLRGDDPELSVDDLGGDGIPLLCQHRRAHLGRYDDAAASSRFLSLFARHLCLHHFSALWHKMPLWHRMFCGIFSFCVITLPP
jgi:hypothetical protein